MTRRHSYSPVFSSAVLAGLMTLTTLGCATSSTSSVPQSTAGQEATIAQAKPKVAEPEKTDTAMPSAQVTPSSQPKVSSQPQQTKTEPVAVQQGKVISSVKADWNGDGIDDNAVLVEAEPDQANLLVYLSESPSQTRLAVNKKNLVWRGAMYGTQPSLSLNPQGSLVIESGNDAIGRGRWQQKITAMYDDSSFVVAGYTYTYRDTLDLAAGGTCDVNFLTRRGVRNNNEFRINAKPLKLADWTEDSAPKECRF
jgi:hypothetical protein